MNISLQRLDRPLPKARGFLEIDAAAHGDDGVVVVVVDFSADASYAPLGELLRVS